MRFWALSPPPIDGCPILFLLCEGWDTQISPYGDPRVVISGLPPHISKSSSIPFV
jgi:hypothetical protein